MISRLLKPKEMKKPDKLTLLSYLSLFYELFLDMEPAPPPSDVGGESPNHQTDLQLMSTPVDKGKEGVAEGSLVKESGSGKKKRNKGSLFRRSSRKKILGASPSSAGRWVGLGYMEAAVLLDWSKQQVKGYGIKVTNLTSSWMMGWPCVPS